MTTRKLGKTACDRTRDTVKNDLRTIGGNLPTFPIRSGKPDRFGADSYNLRGKPVIDYLVQGPFWIDEKPDGESQIKGHNGTIMFRYGKGQSIMADAHLRRLMRSYVKSDQETRNAALDLRNAAMLAFAVIDASEYPEAVACLRMALEKAGAL